MTITGDIYPMLTALQLQNIRVRNAAAPNAPEIGALIADLEERKAENERLAKRNAALIAEVEALQGAVAAQDGRERKAGERCGVDYNLHGCDWPDAVADEIERIRFYCRESLLWLQGRFPMPRTNEEQAVVEMLRKTMARAYVPPPTLGKDCDS